MAGINAGLDAFLRIKDANGVLGGLTNRIHMSQFELATPSELEELLSKGRDDYNTPIGAVANPQPNNFNFTLRGAELEMFRLAFLATVGAITQSATSVTDEAVNIKGTRFKVVGRDISTPVVTGSGGTPTYVLDTDYVLTNARLGIFDVVAGSSLATAVSGAGSAGLNVLVDYARAAITAGVQFAGGTRPNIIMEVTGDGQNRTNLKPFDIFIPECIAAPQGGMDFLSGGFTEVQFQARMVKIAPYTAPFFLNWPQGL